MEERHSHPLGEGLKLRVLEDREKPFWQARLGSECPRRVKRQDRGVDMIVEGWMEEFSLGR